MAGLDFSRIASQSTSDSATEPRRIFSTLPEKDGKYGYPRDVQSEVWEGWHERRKERDLVIKMNTGSGKTVVGLIALKSCLNEGSGPAVYIAPDVYLTEQVANEARQLGLEITDDPHSAPFLQGKAILVANVYKLFNGLSQFGVTGSSREPIDLGTVLIDDAHACLNTVKDQYTLRIPAEHAAYDELFDLFLGELSKQSQANLMKLEEGIPSVVMPIPFWAWADAQKQVVELLHPHREDDDFRFSWPLLVDSLPICRAAISAEAIEISPPCPPVETIPSFDRAERRLYLTATLSDDSVLVTHFGAEAESVRNPITPKSANDLGDRMILTPQQTFPDCDDELLRDFVEEQAETHNTVVIVPSWSRAETWQDRAEMVLGSDGLQEGLEKLRSGHVGLVVLVNKYDGIDLPGDACRLLVIDGLPEAMGTLDRLELLALEGSDALLTRQIQRIEQGMGRGVRSNDDYCCVLLLNRRLTARLHKARDKFSVATKAQLNLSDRVGSMLEGRPFDDLEGVIDQCLERDPSWIAASRDALDEVVYPEHSEIAPTAEAQRQALDLALVGSYPEAVERLQGAIDGLHHDRRLRGLLKEEAASYQHLADPVAAQKLQRSAFADNRSVTKPYNGISYTQLKDTTPQARAAAEFLSSEYADASELVLGVGSLLEQLTPTTEFAAVGRFEQAMKDLARHLGLAAQRPEQGLGRGPDVLWQLRDLNYWVIECKSGSEQERIPKSDMAQLTHSIDWFENEFDDSATATPVLVHPSRVLDSKASARTGTRILTFEKLSALRDAVRTFANSVASHRPYCDESGIEERLVSAGLNAAALGDRWTVATKEN